MSRILSLIKRLTPASFQSQMGHWPTLPSMAPSAMLRPAWSHVKAYSAKVEDPAHDTTSEASKQGPKDESGSSQDKQASKDTVDSTRLKSLETSLAEKEERYRELHKSYLVTLADMENLRARTKKEVENSSLYSITKFAKDLLSVVDVLELALAAVPFHMRPASTSTSSDESQSQQAMQEKQANQANQANQTNQTKEKEASATTVSIPTASTAALGNLYTGVELTLHELLNVLKRNGVESFESLNVPFDPNAHMALYDVPKMDGKAPGSVIDVQKKGYKLKDRILRPAQVGIVRS